MHRLFIALAIACGSAPRPAPMCDGGAALAPPWDGYGLPVDGGRVCSSSPARTELQYESGDRAYWRWKYDAALRAAGFALERCTARHCAFVRAGERAVVQVTRARGSVLVIVRN